MPPNETENHTPSGTHSNVSQYQFKDNLEDTVDALHGAEWPVIERVLMGHPSSSKDAYKEHVGTIEQDHKKDLSEWLKQFYTSDRAEVRARATISVDHISGGESDAEGRTTETDQGGKWKVSDAGVDYTVSL